MPVGATVPFPGFYWERGFFVRIRASYVEFDSGAIKLALYKRLALAKQVGIDPAGTGAHHLAVISDGAFTDPDEYTWLTADNTVTTR